VLHSHYPRSDAEETEATLRAYTDTGLRVGFAASLFTRNFFSYDDPAFLPSRTFARSASKRPVGR
jgi:hypothetical protein